MNWRAMTVAFAMGIAIDVGLVWVYYWTQNEPFQWMGFWIWQAILLAAGILLWLRRLLGFAVWYFTVGRTALVANATQRFLENQFEPFDEWREIEDWLSSHIAEGQAQVSAATLAELTYIRSQGVWQAWMLNAALKKAANNYTDIVQRVQNRRVPI